MVIDSDVLIRYLTKDDQVKAKRFKSFLSSGKKGLLTDTTCAEIYWTLSTLYKMSKKEIIPNMLGIINHKAIKCNCDVLTECFDILSTNNTSLIDAYEAAYAKLYNDSKILSYDRGFDKLKGIKRVEP